MKENALLAGWLAEHAISVTGYVYLAIAFAHEGFMDKLHSSPSSNQTSIDC
jgi:hypothetical protein